MKKNRKIVKHFFAILYCLAMAIPLFSVVYYQIDGLGDYTKFQEDNSNGNSQYEDLPQTYYEKVQYQTNEVNSVDDLVIGNVYRLNSAIYDNSVFWADFLNNDYEGSILLISFNIISSYGSLDEYTIPWNYNTTYNQIYFRFWSDNSFALQLYDNDFHNFMSLVFERGNVDTNCYFQFILDENFNDWIVNEENGILSFLSNADLSECVPTYIEKTTEKKQYYFDDAFGKSYLDFAYGGSQSYSQYYQTIEGDTYQDAYSMFKVNTNGEYTQMLINYDFLNLMGVDGLYSNNHRGAWYLWLNFYINYLLNMAMIIFMPEVLMIFIQWCRDLIYSFTEKVEG